MSRRNLFFRLIGLSVLVASSAGASVMVTAGSGGTLVSGQTLFAVSNGNTLNDGSERSTGMGLTIVSGAVQLFPMEASLMNSALAPGKTFVPTANGTSEYATTTNPADSVSVGRYSCTTGLGTNATFTATVGTNVPTACNLGNACTVLVWTGSGTTCPSSASSYTISPSQSGGNWNEIAFGQSICAIMSYFDNYNNNLQVGFQGEQDASTAVGYDSSCNPIST